mmetsp:Transcript_10663/g.22494  ORF Transcript_10663/g.22494 Transcript_10663/m.22494 type:complete len:230 (+) Transcript_10663:615-1304(+)
MGNKHDGMESLRGKDNDDTTTTSFFHHSAVATPGTNDRRRQRRRSNSNRIGSRRFEQTPAPGRRLDGPVDPKASTTASSTTTTTMHAQDGNQTEKNTADTGVSLRTLSRRVDAPSLSVDHAFCGVLDQGIQAVQAPHGEENQKPNRNGDHPRVGVVGDGDTAARRFTRCECRRVKREIFANLVGAPRTTKPVWLDAMSKRRRSWSHPSVFGNDRGDGVRLWPKRWLFPR